MTVEPSVSFVESLTAAQRDTLSAIAVGMDGGHNPRTLAVLAERGLIVGYRETLPGSPPVEVVRWEVPLPVHVEWARWCAEQPEDEDGR